MAAARKLTKKPSKNQSITLHRIIGAASFWGTTSRVLLTAFLAFFSLLLGTLLASPDLSLTPIEQMSSVIQLTLVTVIAVLAFDGFYITASKLYPINQQLDALLVIVGDITIVTLLLAPLVLSSVSVGTAMVVWVLVSLLFLVSLRALLGILGVSRRG